AGERERLRQAAVLNDLLDRKDAEPAPEQAEALQPLARLVRSSLPRRPRRGALLTLAITLRNDIAHFWPNQQDWWQQAAAALRPLPAALTRDDLFPAGLPDDSFRPPWFLDGGHSGSFNGLSERAALYTRPDGVPAERPDLLPEVLAALGRLLGRTQGRLGRLDELAGSAPDDLKGVLLGDYLVRGPAV